MTIRLILSSVLVSFAVALSARADETFPTLEADGHIYTNVTVTTVTATDIYFTSDNGMGNAKLKNLSPELQARFHYNAGTAAAQENQQALANAQYLASQPPQWGTDLAAALNQARSENKLVLMDFTGSDWCPWCIKLDKDVFSTSQFAGFANNNLELVRLDFPHNAPVNEALRQANAELASRYNVHGYPTCILLDSSGKELGRQVGYAEGGPQAFISRLESFSPTPMRSAATTTQAPLPPVAQVRSLVAGALPKVNWSPNLVTGIAAAPVVLFLMLRKILNARQNL
jgi:thioredoxin-related protein